MTPEQLDIISASAETAAKDPGSFARSFYDFLFSLDPQVRALFASDMSDQYDRLVGELAFLTGAARDLEGFSRRAHDLGQRHAGYGVTADMFPLVQKSLLHALEQHLPDSWDDAHDEAWTAMFTLIAQLMLDGAADAAFAPG